MTLSRAVMICVLSGSVGTSLLCAADFSTYRGLEFGMSVAAATKQGGDKFSGVQVVHQRPALIQQSEWVPQSPAPTDPVKSALLYFFNGELSRIVVTYDRYKVEGLAAEDMIEGISKTYGTATRPTAEIAFSSPFSETTPVIARWEDSEYSYDLIRISERSTFVMILYSKRLDAFAQKAIVEALRLDKDEAPQREIQREAERAEAERLKSEESRLANKPNFRP